MPEIISLREESTGASAEIIASLGFNCFRFTPILDGKPLDVLWSLPDFESGNVRASSSGIPILFPFPGRIAGRRFAWEGKTYELEAGDKFGNAIHGFCHTRAWRVIECSANRAVGQFHAWRDDPTLKDHWPADFRITATYELAGNSLRMDYLVENPCDVALPCGLGTHPYFQLALGAESLGETLVQVPATEKWELVQMLPTGRRLPLEQARELAQGARFRGLQFDDVLAGLAFQDGWCTASLSAPGANRRVTIRFNDTFRECVLFTPQHREAICIEPYTCVPGLFDLTRQGIDAGLRVLAPGESFAARVEIIAS